MRIVKPKRAYAGIGRHAAFESRLLTIHIWRGTFAAWSVCFRLVGWGRCVNWGQPWTG